MRALIFALALLPLPALAQSPVVTQAVEAHILPRMETLAATGTALANAAQADCHPTAPDLRAAFHAATDAWIAVSHLRFGPTEDQNRGFALAFWPDTRGLTPRNLTALIDAQDPAGRDPAAYAEVSIAARGFYALEFLLYDPEITATGNAAYRCALVQTVSGDIAATTAAIADDWQTRYAALLLTAGQNDLYRSEDEALRTLFSALSTGLEFTADTRLGRPLGSFDRPRPTRAEMRRAGRSLRNVALSLGSLQDLALILADDNTVLHDQLNAAFAATIARANTLDDPTFAGTADPQTRIRIEALQQRIADIRNLVAQDLGPSLGVAAGFNSMDGD